jgi:hypothetical protein
MPKHHKFENNNNTKSLSWIFWWFSDHGLCSKDLIVDKSPSKDKTTRMWVEIAIL